MGSVFTLLLPAARAIRRSLRYSTLPPGVNSCDKNFSPLTSRTLLDARPPERTFKTLPGATPAFVPRTHGFGYGLDYERHHYLLQALTT